MLQWWSHGSSSVRPRRIPERYSFERGENRSRAPPLLQIEFAGALTRLAHRRKIMLAAIGDILTEFETLDLVIDKTPPTARTIATVCRRYALSAYDATYFELAMRLGLPLAAKDAPLAEAARKAGVTLA